jgi:hypothetical protein
MRAESRLFYIFLYVIILIMLGSANVARVKWLIAKFRWSRMSSAILRHTRKWQRCK